ncbi:MAG: NUDIX hydrolase [Ruminococcus sp.]|nr:NUDIX hydrolase [Ruminococcus sp.]MBQ9957115.1 NUDIX hydrolase [Ruminococcus sp.]MBR6792363.1 NUDIX hydrolase [Ruminococcus sp.]
MVLNEKKLSSELKYEGLIFNITRDTVELINGNTAFREVLHHPGGVCVIPVTDNNEIYVVKQFRYPFGEVTTEIPAGKMEYGENHAECGKRELLEETGCTCSEYIYLGEVYPVPAYDKEIIHVYLAKGLSFGSQQLDEDEFLNVEKIPLSDAVDMVMNGQIKDSKTQIAILKTARLLGI